MNPGEIIGDLDEKAAKQLGLQQWNQTKGTIYILDSKTLVTHQRWCFLFLPGPRLLIHLRDVEGVLGFGKHEHRPFQCTLSKKKLLSHLYWGAQVSMEIS